MKPIDFLTAQPDNILIFEDEEERITAKRSDFCLVDSFLDESGDIFRTYHGYIPHCRHAEVTIWWEKEKFLLTVVVWRVPFSHLTCAVDWKDEALTHIQGLTARSQDSINSAIYVPYMLVSS